VDSISGMDGITVTVDGMVVTVSFATAVDNFTIASLTGGQTRFSQLEISCK